MCRRESSARAPRSAATTQRRGRKLTAKVGEPLGAGSRYQGIQPGVNQSRLLPQARQLGGSGNPRVIQI
jgi:hypothetical protein